MPDIDEVCHSEQSISSWVTLLRFPTFTDGQTYCMLPYIPTFRHSQFSNSNRCTTTLIH